MSVTPDAAASLRRRITEADRPLRDIVRSANVQRRYHAIWRWYVGKQDHIDLLTAEALHYELTGRGFVPVTGSPAEGEIKR